MGRRGGIGHRLEYAAVRATAFLVGLLPLRLALAFGSALGAFAWLVLRVRRGVVLTNLELAFPGSDEAWRRRTALRSYVNVGRFVMELARQERLGPKWLERHVGVADREALERVRAGGGALLITGHFGNWELMGVALAHFLGDVSFLVGRQSNPYVDRWINHLRSSMGITLYGKRSAVRGVVDSLGRGGYVCWLSDQDARDAGIMVDFFGRAASTPRGAALFSVKRNAPVVPVFLERTGGGPNHRLIVGEPIRPPEGLPAAEAELAVTREYTRRIEEAVRERPDMYWWAHRRWKSSGLYDAPRRGDHPARIEERGPN